MNVPKKDFIKYDTIYHQQYYVCPKCGSDDISTHNVIIYGVETCWLECNDCGLMSEPE